ncbi:restriction endonuclease subunit S [Tetragenococcus halophilus]|uniref:restriction endonuclease subunit S n=1 Tax=Tetragenococcus halophilus TaxID=51669 RepID=UPI0030C93B50
MSKEEKRVPEVRFEGFYDDWKQRKLSELMTFSNGINAPKENYGKGRKMISVMDILQEAPIKYENIRSSVKVDEKIEVKNKVENGDLVFVRSSEVREEVGWAKAYLEEKYALYSGFSIRGKKQNEFNSHFIELTLNSVNRKQLERKAGGSTRFNVSQNILNNVEIFSPTIEEQNTIDKLFKVFNDAITLHQEKLSKLQSLKKAALQSLFPQKDETEPKVRFANFKSKWSQRQLGETLIERNIQQTQSIEYPLVSFTVQDGVTPKTERYNRQQLVRGSKKDKKYKVTEFNDIVYNPANLKFGAIARNKYGKAVLSPIYVTFRVNQEIVYPSYIEMTVTNPDFIKYSLRYQQGTVYERQSVNPEDLLSLYISIPEKEEQSDIGLFFEQLNNDVELYKSKLEKLQRLKKSFLQRMFI